MFQMFSTRYCALRAAETVAAAEAAKPTYTVEQRSAAKEMLRYKNHYDRLGVARTATEVEIKSAYRRKAMLFHPDRNSAPEAEEAFKSVSAAFQCLSDPSKRCHYNQTGEEDNSSSSSSGAARTHTHQYYSREADLTTEDVFKQPDLMSLLSQFAHFLSLSIGDVFDLS